MVDLSFSLLDYTLTVNQTEILLTRLRQFKERLLNKDGLLFLKSIIENFVDVNAKGNLNISQRLLKADVMQKALLARIDIIEKKLQEEEFVGMN